MDELIRNQIGNIASLSTKSFVLIVIIIVILGLLFLTITENDIFLIGIIFGILIFLVYCLDFSTTYANRVSYISEKETVSISILPNQVMNNDTYTFLVNNKELKALKYDNTKYFQDSKDKPYIIVEKIKYCAPNSFLIDNSSINKINNKIVYILDEVHY